MNDTFGRGRNRLETTATVMVILLSAVASLWMVRDATSAQTEAGRPPTSARTQPTRPTRPAPAALPTEPLSVEGATLKGDMRAGVALIVYSDFECPFCSRFALDTWPSLEQKYVSTGKVRVAFRHLPIESIHRYALKASEAAACADQQAKFWPMHDVLFKNPKQLDDASLAKYAKELKLDEAAFGTCLKGAMTSRVKADAATAAALGITGTPAFLVGAVQQDGRVKVTDRITGARPVAAFESALDKVLSTVTAGTK